MSRFRTLVLLAATAALAACSEDSTSPSSPSAPEAAPQRAPAVQGSGAYTRPEGSLTRPSASVTDGTLRSEAGEVGSQYSFFCFNGHCIRIDNLYVNGRPTNYVRAVKGRGRTVGGPGCMIADLYINGRYARSTNQVCYSGAGVIYATNFTFNRTFPFGTEFCHDFRQTAGRGAPPNIVCQRL